MKKFTTIIVLSLLSFLGFSQHGINDLKKQLAESKTDTGHVRRAIDLSWAYFSINIDSAIYYGRLGVQLARDYNDEADELEAQLALGEALSERDIPQSMQVYYYALQLAEKTKNPFSLGQCYKGIGLLHLYLGNGDLYAAYLQKAIIFYRKANLTSLVAQCYAEIGGIYGVDKPDSARYYLTLASVDTFQQHSAFYNYYWAMLESNFDPQKARYFFDKSLQISKYHNNLRAQSLAYRWLSIFYQKQGQLDSAILAAGNGLMAAKQLNFLRGIINNSRRLSLVYKDLKQTDSAYKYMGIMIVAQDSLLSPEKINQIQTAIIAEQQRVQKLQVEKKSLQDRIKLYASLAIGFVLLLFVLFFHRNQRKTQRSNKLLKFQSEEINKKRDELQQSLDALKTTQAQLIQSEKMASLGELTAGIAHEIQNPLNFVNNFSEVNKELLVEMNEEIQKGNYDEVKIIAKDITDNEEKINHHGKRADAIVKGMLQHSRSSNGIKEPTDINALCDEYLRLSYHGLRAKDKSFNATMKTDFDRSIGATNIIPQDIGRVILNLITNAFYVVDEKKKAGIPGYEPTVSVSTKKSGDKVEIRVEDNGGGIPPAIFDKIFQPFFTTKPTGQGTGLGLSLSYDIVKAHGGEISVNTKQSEGTEFCIKLPKN